MLHLDLQGLAANLVQKTGKSPSMRKGHVKMQKERYFSFVSPSHVGSLKMFLRQILTIPATVLQTLAGLKILFRLNPKIPN